MAVEEPQLFRNYTKTIKLERNMYYANECRLIYFSVGIEIMKLVSESNEEASSNVERMGI